MQIIDTSTTPGVLIPSVVLVNGTNLGFITDVSIDLVNGGATTVTVTLLPDHVVIRHVDEMDEQ